MTSTQQCLDLRTFEVQFPAGVEKMMHDAFAKQPADEQQLSSFAAIKRALVAPTSYTSIRVNTACTTRDKVVKQLTECLKEFNIRLRNSGREHQVLFLHG